MTDDNTSNDQQGPYGQYPYGSMGSGKLPKPSSGISFQKGELAAAGTRIDGQTATFDALKGKSSSMGVPFPAFGVVGMGIAQTHDKAIQHQSEALERGKVALESWKSALTKADANYTQADDDSGKWPKGPGGPEYKGPGGPGGIDPSKFKGPGDINPGDLDPKDLNKDLPSDLDKDLNKNLPSDLDKDLNKNLPSDLDKDLNKNLDDIQKPDVSGVNSPDMKVPSIDSALNPNSGKTDLSSYNPNNPLNPNLGGTPNYDPSLSRNGTSLGPATGSGAGGVGSGGIGAGALRGAGAAGAAGSGMPMMPMMPMSGQGQGQDDRDREKSALLSEDEGVWGSDEDVAPEVIGQEI